MTEAEWLGCTDPQKMLHSLQGKASDRKVVLFLCACGRRLKSLLTDERCLLAIETVEKYVDGQVNKSVLMKTLQATEAVVDSFVGDDDVDPSLTAAIVVNDTVLAATDKPGLNFIAGLANYAAGAMATASTDSSPASREVWLSARSGEATAQADLLREIFGNPFHHSPPLPPAMVTPTVIALARAIYNERTFDRLSIIADALVNAGCTNEDILDHCRQSGEHIRGCWALDLVLAKE